MTEMWKHQEYAVRLAEVEQDLALFFEQGTGKTRTLIEILRRKYAKAGGIEKTLIFSLPRVCPQWKYEEFPKYSKIPLTQIVILNGSEKKRCADFIKAVGEDLTGNKIILTNYEALQMKSLHKLLVAWKPVIMGYDESDNLKNPQGKRAKAAVPLSDGARNRYILTGTPVLNDHGMDLYMQFRLLDCGKTFGTNHMMFKLRYFEDKNVRRKGTQGYFPDWQPRPAAEEELRDKIKKKAIRILKKDCLDLPPLVKQVVYTEMSKEQAKAYREMYSNYITWVKSKEGEPRASVAELAVTKSLRLQQIVSGFIKDEDGSIHRVPCPRLDDLRDILERITPANKAIIWAAFEQNYEDIAKVCDSIGVEYRFLHGGVSGNQGLENIKEFRTDPNVKVLISHPRSGGAGLNLIEAAYSIYYSKTWSLRDELQSEARNHRGGSEIHEQITRIDLVCKGTIDELIAESLAAKDASARNILSWTERMKYVDS
jgi:SNF2 family DNA or RNA helicase